MSVEKVGTFINVVLIGGAAGIAIFGFTWLSTLVF